MKNEWAPIPEQEALDIEKEMFIKGGGVKVGQTMEEYKAEREEIWDRTHSPKEQPQVEESSETSVNGENNVNNLEPVITASKEELNTRAIEEQEVKDKRDLKKVRQELGLTTELKEKLTGSLAKVQEYDERIRAAKNGKPIKIGDTEAGLLFDFKSFTKQDWNEDFDINKFKKTKELQAQNIEGQSKMINFLESEVLPEGQPVSVGEFYEKLNKEFPLSFDYKDLVKIADGLNIKICRRPTRGNSANFAEFDYPVNTINIETQKALLYGGKLNPERLASEIMAHEIIHGIIHNKFPTWDFKANKAPESRKQINIGLSNLVRSLEAFRGQTGNSRADKILEIIVNAQRAPEEIVTYSLTDADFRVFMERTGQMEYLFQFLKENGLGELETIFEN